MLASVCPAGVCAGYCWASTYSGLMPVLKLQSVVELAVTGGLLPAQTVVPVGLFGSTWNHFTVNPEFSKCRPGDVNSC